MKFLLLCGGLPLLALASGAFFVLLMPGSKSILIYPAAVSMYLGLGPLLRRPRLLWIKSRRQRAHRDCPLSARRGRSAQLLTSDIGASRSRSLDETVITPDCALAFTSADKLQPISMQRHSASALDQGFVTDV